MANNIITSANARKQAINRLQAFDPRTYSIPDRKRVDGKWTATTLLSEAIFNAELNAYTRAVRVKNTTGSDWDPGTLLQQATLALTPAPTQVATNSPVAGASVVITMASSANFQVGQIVTIESNGYTEYSFVTAVAAGQITVDFVLFDHATPTVTAVRAVEATLAEAGGANTAYWVVDENGIADGDYGFAYGSMIVGGLDTSAFTVEQFVYLSATPGAWGEAPVGDYVNQVVGIVSAVDAALGEVIFQPELQLIKSFSSAYMTAPDPLAIEFFEKPLPQIPYGKLEAEALNADALSYEFLLQQRSLNRYIV